MRRFGFDEESYFTFSYSAIRDETGGVGSVQVTCIETDRARACRAAAENTASAEARKRAK